MFFSQGHQCGSAVNNDTRRRRHVELVYFTHQKDGYKQSTSSQGPCVPAKDFLLPPPALSLKGAGECLPLMPPNSLVGHYTNIYILCNVSISFIIHIIHQTSSIHPANMFYLSKIHTMFNCHFLQRIPSWPMFHLLIVPLCHFVIVPIFHLVIVPMCYVP